MTDPQMPSGPAPQDDAAPNSPVELAEFRAVSNLLRHLPEPEPPEDLRHRVMEAVEAERSRPRVVRGLFGSGPQGIAAALAAGIAGWMFLVSPQGLPGTTGAQVVQGGNASEGAAAGPVKVAGARPTPSRLAPAAVTPPTPQALFASDGLLAERSAPRTLPPLDRRLDRQIDQMLHQPDAFFQRLERIHENERYLARLAERSARRGDSVAVALQVRNTRHPLAPKIAEQFLRASLSRSTTPPPRPAASAPATLESLLPGVLPRTPHARPATVYSH